MPEHEAPKMALFVLGMHRSGTSALTEAVSQLGFSLPATLLSPSKFNPKGYWESEKINQLNDRIFARQGLGWLDWKTFNMDLLSGDDRAAIVSEISETVTEEFQGSRSIVIKDPRICRFAPLYFEALNALGYKCLSAIIYRNPLEVMASLAKRQSLGGVTGGLLWLQYNLDVELATRVTPRVYLSNSSLISRKSAYLSERIGRLGGAELSGFSEKDMKSVDETFDDSLKNESASLADVQGHELAGNVIFQTYQLLQGLESDENDAAVKAEIDVIRSAVSITFPLLDGAIKQKDLEYEARVANASEHHQTEIASKNTDAEVLRSDLRTSTSRLDVLTSEIVEERLTHQAALEELKEDIQAVQSEKFRLEESADSNKAQLAEKTQAHEEQRLQYEKSMSELVLEMDQLKEQWTESEQKLRTDLEAQTAAFHALKNEKTDSDRHIENLTAMIANQTSELEVLSELLKKNESSADRKVKKLKSRAGDATDKAARLQAVVEEKNTTLALMEKMLEEQRSTYDQGLGVFKQTTADKTQKIAELAEALAGIKVSLKNQKATLTQQTQRVADRDARLSAFERDVEQHSAIASERAEKIDAQAEALLVLKADLDTQQALADERAALIADCEARFSGYEKDLTEQQAVIDEKTEVITKQIIDISSKIEAEAGLNRAVEVLSQTLSDTNALLVTSRREYENLFGEHESLSQLTSDLRDQVQRQDTFIDSLSNSKVWKFSKLLSRRDSVLLDRPDVYQPKLPDLRNK